MAKDIPKQYKKKRNAQYRQKMPCAHPYLKGVMIELDNHCRSIVDLEDRLGHPIDQHHSWARIAINKLESNHCFKIK